MLYIKELFVLMVQYAPDYIGVVMPILIEFINKDIPGSNTKFVISFIVCFVVGAILDWHQISLGTPAQALTTVGIIFMESQAVHKLFFRTSWLADLIANGLPAKSSSQPTKERTLND